MMSAVDGLVGYLLAATQQAALACQSWVGHGDPKAADAAAVRAMRNVLADVPADLRVVIGEGAKDDAPMLHEGERLGTGEGPAIDLAVDPLECTNACADASGSAFATLAAAPRGALMATPGWYMDKLVVGPEAARSVDIRLPLTDNLDAIAAATGKERGQLRAVVLDKPRHADLITHLRDEGVAVSLIPDGDVLGSLRVVLPNGDADLLIGIGGAPEGVLSACAVRVLRGGMQGLLAPQKPGERERVEAAGQDPDAVLGLDDLVSTDDCLLLMTAITDSPLLREPRTVGDVTRTSSLVVSPLHPGVVVEGAHGPATVPSTPRSPAYA